MKVKANNVLVKGQKALEEVKANKSWLGGHGFLQTFTGDGGTDDKGDGGGQGNDNDDLQGDDKGQGLGADDKGSGASDKDQKFTQDDVNNIAAREAKRATEKILKQLGVKDAKSAKDALDKFNKMQDDQKTDAQKLADSNKELETNYNDASQKVKTLEAQVSAMKAGVKVESLDDVIVLANNLVSDDVTIDDAITQIIEKYPHFKTNAQQEDKGGKKKPKFSEGEHKKEDKQSDQDKWKAAFNFSNIQQ